MVESRVVCSRINQLRQTHLFNSPEPLKGVVIYNIEYQIVGNGNEPVHRIIDNLLFVQALNFKRIKLAARAKFYACKDITFCGRMMR